MSSTSSEEQKNVYDTAPKGSGAVEGEEDGHRNYLSRAEEYDSKGRPPGVNRRAREIARFAPSGHREPSSSKHHMTDVPQRNRPNSSRDPSVSRSEGRSRSKSPAASLMYPSRVGKRVRRAPQRWDGERREPRSSRGAPVPSRYKDMEPIPLRDSDEETESAASVPDELQTPKMDDPVKEMNRAVAVVSTSSSRRLCVDAFHTWQLQSVSKQAAQQKALHVFLKRKLRKRISRAPEIDRLEEDALRNARNATFKSKEKTGRGDSHIPTTVEDQASKMVPTKMRLPLEAYLPRRARANKEAMTPDEVFSSLLLPPPHLPGSPEEEVERAARKWLEVPMVTALSSLNRHKPPSRYNNKRHALTPAKRARGTDE